MGNYIGKFQWFDGVSISILCGICIPCLDRGTDMRRIYKLWFENLLSSILGVENLLYVFNVYLCIRLLLYCENILTYLPTIGWTLR